MSELIQHRECHLAHRSNLLLLGVSALALMTYASAGSAAKAEGDDRPTLWIELGGSLDQTEGLSQPFAAPFMSATTPTAYRGGVFDQGMARYALGLDGKLSFQPEGTDWTFSAGVRFGRSHRNRHVHNQTAVPSVVVSYYGYTFKVPLAYDQLADSHLQNREQHTVIDFSAGRDVGLGLLSRQGTSNLNLGVRIAQFSAKSDVEIEARPTIGYTYPLVVPYPFATFHEHKLDGQAVRSFRGVGPALSWTGSAPLVGNPQAGELTVDWGVSAALLFGRQKARVSHSTQTHHLFHSAPGGYFNNFHLSYELTGSNANTSDRSRNVAVPNVGASMGLSVKYPNAKFSLGYRIDTFFGAMDTGIDIRRASDVTFRGPYAAFSIGLGD